MNAQAMACFDIVMKSAADHMSVALKMGDVAIAGLMPRAGWERYVFEEPDEAQIQASLMGNANHVKMASVTERVASQMSHIDAAPKRSGYSDLINPVVLAACRKSVADVGSLVAAACAYQLIYRGQELTTVESRAASVEQMKAALKRNKVELRQSIDDRLTLFVMSGSARVSAD